MAEDKDIDFINLLADARRAMTSSYSPYSNFKVGSAILTSKRIYTGANVENASYGLTICAERVAIFNAILKEGSARIRIRAIAIANNRDVSSPPCGACLQVISEFTKDAKIAFPFDNEIKIVEIGDLLTYSFGSVTPTQGFRTRNA